jgi:hypothetical protein
MAMMPGGDLERAAAAPCSSPAWQRASPLNLRDSSIAHDGLHLVAPANRRVAEALVGPVGAVLR